MAAALPRTLGELQLYRILQRANLLCYYETFIQQGGDDVQQLCEAGEDEFLEIMALVGMASKPLHVRRLQKALRDWVTNPALFSQPRATPACSIPVYKLLERAAGDPEAAPDAELAPASPRLWIGRSADSEASLSPAEPGTPASPLEALDAAAVRSVVECVTRIAQTLPKVDPVEVKDLLKANKKLGKTISHIFDMSNEDPHREEEIRKYSAIYGRFDSKRRDGKQLTLHELTVNEAAAQLCMRNMALLTRRDELFGLARQVSREVTYKYTYQNSRSQCGDRDDLSPKRIKTEEAVSELLEAEPHTCTQQEPLKEHLAASMLGEVDTAGQSLLPPMAAACLPSPLTQTQIERLLTKQMEILHNASAHGRVQGLSWMFPAGHPKQHRQKHSPNGLSSNKTEQEADQPSVLRASGPRRSIAEGVLPLGRQLASELKKRHSICGGRPLATENGSRMNSQKGVLNLSDKKTIKLEPEEST